MQLDILVVSFRLSVSRRMMDVRWSMPTTKGLFSDFRNNFSLDRICSLIRHYVKLVYLIDRHSCCGEWILSHSARAISEILSTFHNTEVSEEF